MGGPGIAIDAREAASALRWWLDAGVDVATQEEPRNWLERTPEIRPLDPSPEPEPPPSTLEAFRRWLAGPDAPLASARSKPVLPDGAEGAEVMLLCEPPRSMNRSSAPAATIRSSVQTMWSGRQRRPAV